MLSIMAAIHLLGIRNIVDEKAALNGVHTHLVQLMEGDRFWNVVAVSFMCMPWGPKLWGTRRNGCSVRAGRSPQHAPACTC